MSSQVHEGQFLNIKYGKRFGKLNEDAQKAAFVEFTGVNILGTRTLRGKRFISNYFQKKRCDQKLRNNNKSICF